MKKKLEIPSPTITFEEKNMKGYSTKLIHGKRVNNDVHHSLRFPVYDSNAFEFDNSEQIAASFRGEIDAYAYSRTANPTITELESRMQVFASARNALCVSSGMSAINNAMLSLCRQGDNFISSPFLFGHTYALFNTTYRELGIEARFVDMDNPAAIEKLIDKNTRVIFLENISNPQLIVHNIRAIADIARRYSLILVVDNTMPTPYLFQSSLHGVDVEVMSNTKTISGGATTVGGTILIYDSDKWAANPLMKPWAEQVGKDCLIKKLRKEIYRNLGNCTTPHNSYMQLLGLETLPLRIEKYCSNALETASFLKELTQVQSVNYPALSDHPSFPLLKEQYNGKCGPMIVFELESQQACFRFMDKLKMIRRATNFCDNKSLIIHPCSTIYCEYSEEQREIMRVNDRMIRLSVGIEDVEDIKADILQAMEK